jgi:site-specific DNA recombinase
VRSLSTAASQGGHVSRNADTLDAFVVDAVIARLSQPGFIAAMADRVSADGTAEQAALINERDQIRLALDGIAKAMEGTLTPALVIQMTGQAQQLSERADEISHILAAAGQRSPVAELIGCTDIRAAWDALALPTQRRILEALVTVTVNTGKRGRYFDPDSIVLDFN